MLWLGLLEGMGAMHGSGLRFAPIKWPNQLACLAQGQATGFSAAGAFKLHVHLKAPLGSFAGPPLSSFSSVSLAYCTLRHFVSTRLVPPPPANHLSRVA